MSGRRGTLRWATVVCGCLCAAGAAAIMPADLGPVVFEKSSLYHRIFVHRQGSLVSLQFGGRGSEVVQSAVDLADVRRHVLEYTTLAFAGVLHKSEPRNVLVVGLGGGVIPREMHHYFPEAQVDVVEIDPAIPPIAEQYFGFRPDERLRVHVEDGRRFIASQLRKDTVPRYDYVVLDAFTSDYIPFHLMTREFLQQVRGILSDDGVVVANVFVTNRLAHAEWRTFIDVFGRCQAYVGANSANALLVSPGAAAPVLTAQQAAERAATLQEQHAFAFDLRVVATRLRPDGRPEPDAPILTDDRAPVNRLRWQETEDDGI